MMNNKLVKKVWAALTIWAALTPAMADTSVSGYVTQLMVADSGNPDVPAAILTLNPPVDGCNSGFLVISSTNAPVGKMMLATALSAQTASNPLVILYTTSSGRCVIKQMISIAQ